MDAVQRLRAEARSAGNLVTTPEQEIVDDAGYIEIWPAQPRVIYVPVYDPSIVYFGRGGIFADGVISFGRGFALGVWLNHDCDWRGHRVYYHGWNDDRGWVRRSRPYVQVTNVYVNVNYRNVVVNRTVVNRSELQQSESLPERSSRRRLQQRPRQQPGEQAGRRGAQCECEQQDH
jgi:hypothetical protein